MTRRSIHIACLLFLTTFTSFEVAALPEFTKLVKSAAPAVVNISATRESAPSGLDQFDGREVPEFFRRFFGELPQQQQPRPSAGSGFILSRDGYVLTNYHVVQGADEIVVALSDRRELVATMIGADTLSDLALLKIDADNLPTVKLGNSDKLEVGEWVVAIGSPFGFEHSVTAGIVSAKGRSLPDPTNGNYVPFIQTDVAINPGNSGGPLFNLDGEVVGINSQIFTRSGGFMGLSFAIPVDVAMEVVDQLKESGEVSRGYLGVLIQRVDRDLAESFGLDRAAGALVTKVFQASPAEEAGIQEGDIILEFAGRQIDLSSELPHVVGRTKPDTTARIVYVRGGKRMTGNIKIGTLDQSTIPDQRQGAGPAVPGTGNRLGVEIRDLRPEEKERMGVDRGVGVVRVGSGPAETAGIRAGDIVTTINNEWVDSLSDFNRVVNNLPANTAIPVRIVRGGSPEFTVIKILE